MKQGILAETCSVGIDFTTKRRSWQGFAAAAAKSRKNLASQKAACYNFYLLNQSRSRTQPLSGRQPAVCLFLRFPQKTAGRINRASEGRNATITAFDAMRQLNTASVLLRLMLATVLGGMIGMEREFKRCTAGTKTPDERADPAAAQPGHQSGRADEAAARHARYHQRTGIITKQENAL